MTKKRFLAILATISTMTLFLVFGVACGKDDGGGENPPQPQEIQLTLNRAEADLIYGDTLELVATYSGGADGLTLAWTTSAPTVATVEGGTVTAVGEGDAVITVTYGDKSKTCSVSVSYGNIQPQLVLSSLGEGNTIDLQKGGTYKLQAEISFNGKTYPYDSLAVELDGDGVSFDKDTAELSANSKGTFNITVTAGWREFTGALLSENITVNVSADLTATTYFTVNDEKTVATDTTIYLTDEWYGKTFPVSAKFEAEAWSGAVKLDASSISAELSTGSDLISFNEATGEITVNNDGKTGDATITLTIQDDGDSAQVPVTVHVVCPEAKVDTLVEYCDETGLVEGETWADFLGATILETGSKQGTAELTYREGRFAGLTINGMDTEDITIRTNKGLVTFTNLDAYTTVLTAENVVAKLNPETSPNGYYILKSNVTADFQSQSKGSAGAYFSGTFDGRGYVLNATVSGAGVFGAIGNGGIVKNTHFNFTFGTPASALNHGAYTNVTNYCSGLSANDDQVLEGYTSVRHDVTLQNLYITTTNYKTNSFVLMAVKPFFLKMTDVYVELGGVPSDYAFTNAREQHGVLFGADRNGAGRANSDSAMSEIASGKLTRNVYAVTKKFMALSAVRDQQNGARYSVWYARNDIEDGKLGTVGHRSNSVEGATSYLQIYNNNGENTQYDALFGTGYEKDADTKYAANPFTCMNTYIYRYDTLAELRAAHGSLTQIGDWSLEGVWQGAGEVERETLKIHNGDNVVENDGNVDMTLGDDLTLRASYTAMGGVELSWASDNSAVTVEDGVLTAREIGTAKITVTYGVESISFNVTVGYGDLTPVLKAPACITDGAVNVDKGSSFKLEGWQVKFNGLTFACDVTAVVTDETVLSYDAAEGTLTGLKSGTTTVTVSASWGDFENVQSTLTVTVQLDAQIAIQIDGTAKDSADLYLTDAWLGERYATSVTLSATVTGNGVPADAVPAYSLEGGSNADLVSLSATSGSSTVVTVNTEGLTGTVTLYVTYSDGEYSRAEAVTITVIKPEGEYTDPFEYAECVFVKGSSTPIPGGPVNVTWAAILGVDYEVLSVRQGESTLTFAENGTITGLVVNGYDTEEFTIETKVGTVTFTNLDAYTASIDRQNAWDALNPANNLAGYYVMTKDMESSDPANLVPRQRGDVSKNFHGVFDGRGHKFVAKVGGRGIFGAIGGGAVIKNTYFELTFDGEPLATLPLSQYNEITNSYCGLAANDDRDLEGWTGTRYDISLENLYFKTTNYKTNAFVLMTIKPIFLQMHDIYIEVNGVPDDFEYTNAKTQRGILFGMDRIGTGKGTNVQPDNKPGTNIAQQQIALGNFVKNVYLVTQKFMSLSAARDQENGTDRWSVWYAGNDVDDGKLGTVGHRDNSSLGSTNYLQIYNNNGENTQYDALFGTGYENQASNKYASNPFTCMNPFIYRYDTLADLQAAHASLTKIGSWSLGGVWQA